MDTKDYAAMLLRHIASAKELGYKSHIHDFPDEVSLADIIVIKDIIDANGYTADIVSRKYGKVYTFQLVTTGW